MIKLKDFQNLTLPSWKALLRKHFFAGLLIVIPLGVIFWILGAVIGSVWQIQNLFPAEWQAENLFEAATTAFFFKVLFTVLIVASLAFLLSLLGWLSKLYLGKKALEVLSDFIQRIPVLRSIYSALDQLMRTLGTGTGQQFSRVVYVEYPRKDMWTLAFVTGSVALPNETDPFVGLYVPTTPNPTSGFYLIVKEAEVKEAKMKIEDAFKIILSLGIASSKGSTDHG